MQVQYMGRSPACYLCERKLGKVLPYGVGTQGDPISICGGGHWYMVCGFHGQEIRQGLTPPFVCLVCNAHGAIQSGFGGGVPGPPTSPQSPSGGGSVIRAVTSMLARGAAEHPQEAEELGRKAASMLEIMLQPSIEGQSFTSAAEYFDAHPRLGTNPLREGERELAPWSELDEEEFQNSMLLKLLNGANIDDASRERVYELVRIGVWIIKRFEIPWDMVAVAVQDFSAPEQVAEQAGA